MNKTLKFEFYRLIRSKAFIICLVLSGLGVAVLAVTEKLLLEGLGGEAFGTTSLSMLKGIGSNFTLLAAVFTSVFVTADFSSDTLKNIYSKGFSRESVFWAKYLVSLVGCGAFLLLNGLLQFLLGATLFDGIGTPGKNYALSFIAIVLLYLSYHAIYFALAVSFRKVGAAIALSIIGPSGIELLLSLVEMLIKKGKYAISDYWISGRITALMKADVSLKAALSGLAVALAVSAAALAASFFIDRKRDC